MRIEEVLAELEGAGSEQTRRTYRRHGITGPAYGVSYAMLGKLQKRIKSDHPLALALWATGNQDARVLATKVADPGRLTVKEADAWVKESPNATLAEAVAALVARSPLAPGRAAVWRDRRDEWTASAGWVVTAHLAMSGTIPVEEGAALLDQIEREIHGRPNRVRYEMNSAVIAFGSQPALTASALAAADRIGQVDVDHGETSCKTPDAGAYIHRMLARSTTRAR